MYKPVIDKIISQRADEFAQREYMSDSYERDTLSKGYYWGYKDAEKDLALTWQDIKNIDDWLSVIQTSDNLVGKELYEEVLRRFNEAKNNRQRK